VVDRPITPAPAGLVIAGQHGNSFQQRRFAGAVFADDDGDRTVESQLEVVTQERKAERIGLAVLDARWIEPDAPAGDLPGSRLA
jgi:hypothetical protein